MRGRPSSRARGPAGLLVGLAILGLLGPVLSVPDAAAHPAVPRLPTLPERFGSPARTAPALPYDRGAGARPDASYLWYLQEGATLNAINGTSGSSKELALTVTLVDSGQTTAVELNGLSSSGDWFQVTIADNWCSAGYAMLVAEFSSADAVEVLDCLHDGAFDRGDTVDLTLNVTNRTSVCLGAADTSRGTSYWTCEAQADTGATGWVTTSGAGNANGYFTGPMTETINETLTSCPDYPDFPTVVYRWTDPFWTTSFVPWSDAFNEEASPPSICYSSTNATAVALTPLDPASAGADTSNGTGFVARWVLGSNASLVDPGVDLEIETDAVPITAVDATASASEVVTGTPVNLSVASVTGGVGPYSALWFENGTPTSVTTRNWTFLTDAGGSYDFQAFAVDRELTVAPAPGNLTVVVRGPLAAGTLAARPGEAVDVGETLHLTAAPTGGTPPYGFTWEGLPTGCVSQNASTLNCTPTAAGPSTVSVVVADASGGHQTSPALAITVAPALSVGLSASPSEYEVDEPFWLNASVSGGAAPYQYVWSGLRGDCGAATSADLQCDPLTTGELPVVVNVTDANGGFATGALGPITIGGPPSANLTALPSDPEVGEPTEIAFNVTGGVPGFSVVWSGLPLGCPSTDALVLTCRPEAVAGFTIGATLTDALGATATAGPLALTIQPGPVPTIAVSAPTVAVGATLTLGSRTSGGTPGYSYSWSGLPPGCPNGPTNATIVCRPDHVGRYEIVLSVTDAVGGTGNTSLVLTVTSASTPPSPVAWIWIGAGLLGALALAAVSVAYLRRGRRRPRAGEPDGPP